MAGGLALTLVLAACSDDDDDDGNGGEAAAEGATFSFVPLDAGGPNTKAALKSGDIDIALLFSSDGAIAANDWVALDDDKELQPVDNFVPAVRAEVADAVEPVLDAVSEALTVEAMQEMVAAVAVDGENPDAVAGEFLADSVELPDATVSGSFTVGSADFAESEITAELYAQALTEAGATVDKKLGIGAREVYFEQLTSGGIDIVPEFVGTLAFFLDPDAEITSDLEASLAVSRSLAEAKGVTLLEPSEADSVNTFVVTRDTAEKYDLASVSDLAGVEDSLTLGGPPECPERKPCLLGLEEVYGLKFDA